jgi:hypothetical protein
MNAMDEEMLRRAWEGAEGECGGFVGCWAAGLHMAATSQSALPDGSRFRLDGNTIR